jgi:hypothetical protein
MSLGVTEIVTYSDLDRLVPDRPDQLITTRPLVPTCRTKKLVFLPCLKVLTIKVATVDKISDTIVCSYISAECRMVSRILLHQPIRMTQRIDTTVGDSAVVYRILSMILLIY